MGYIPRYYFPTFEGLPLLLLVASQFCSERVQGCKNARMQGLLYARTRCCSSEMVVPTGCYWVALILEAARVLRATSASASCALCQAGWFSQELNYSHFQLLFLLYCNIFSYNVPPDHSVIFRKPDLPIRLILRQKLKSNGYFNMHSTFKLPIWSVEEL